MALDWANEPYVRLYKKETADDLLLSFEARAVWHEMLKKFDRSGLIETRRGAVGLAALIRAPLELVERVLPELYEDGRVVPIADRGFASRNYIVANETPRSNKARQEEHRVRRQQDALSAQESTSAPVSEPSHDVTQSNAPVTPSNATSRSVTHNRSYTDQREGASAPLDSDGLTDLKTKVDNATGDIGKQRNKRAAKAHPDRQRVMDAFHQRFLSAYGKKPSWEGKERGLLDSLLRRQPADELIERMDFMFSGKVDWPPGPYTIDVFSTHLDRWVTAQLPLSQQPRKIQEL